jgi:hypothetical protein
MSRRDRSRILPSVEPLEGRELLSGVKNVPTSFLFTPIPEGAPLAEHIHPHLTILVDGQLQVIPAGIGLGANGNLPLHTHNASGYIHVESSRVEPFRLRDFFTIWGQTLSNKNVLGHRADRTHKITMTVDGRPSNAFGTLLLRDLQDIVINYTTVSRPQKK